MQLGQENSSTYKDLKAVQIQLSACPFRLSISSSSMDFKTSRKEMHICITLETSKKQLQLWAWLLAEKLGVWAPNE